MHHWRPAGRRRDFNHLRPSEAGDIPERRASHARATLAALGAVGATEYRLDEANRRFIEAFQDYDTASRTLDRYGHRRAANLLLLQAWSMVYWARR
eukprot:500218-Alexandrium_andersonii.AAC.1